MSIIVRDTRKFPLQKVPYLDIRLDDLFESLLTIKRANCPNWTDESSSDFGVQLLWMYSVLSQWLIDHMERAKDNCYLLSAQDREHVRRLCQLIDYGLTEAGAASVDVTFILEDGHPEFTIPAGTKVSTEEADNLPAIIFETASDELVGVGIDEVSVTCVQGETISQENAGSSDGTTGQNYILARKPVVWQSETVEVFEGGTWNEWTRVDNFVESTGTDTYYRIEVDGDGNYGVYFGDGTNGKIPSRGTNNIRVTYRKGGGTEGNVGANTITELISSVSYVESVNNASAASGGSDRETLEHARVFAPVAAKALERGVTIGDVEFLSETFVSTKYGGIAIAKAFEIGGTSLRVMVVPRSGGDPSAGLKTELLEHLESKRISCTWFQIKDPTYVPIDVTATIWTLPNCAVSEVIAQVRTRLIAYLAPTYQDPQTGLYPHGFGRDIHLSDIYALIDNSWGVDHCQIDIPLEDVLIDSYKIADVGTITLKANTPTGETAYHETKPGAAIVFDKNKKFAL